MKKTITSRNKRNKIDRKNAQRRSRTPPATRLPDRPIPTRLPSARTNHKAGRQKELISRPLTSPRLHNGIDTGWPWGIIKTILGPMIFVFMKKKRNLNGKCVKAVKKNSVKNGRMQAAWQLTSRPRREQWTPSYENIPLVMKCHPWHCKRVHLCPTLPTYLANSLFR